MQMNECKTTGMTDSTQVPMISYGKWTTNDMSSVVIIICEKKTQNDVQAKVKWMHFFQFISDKQTFVQMQEVTYNSSILWR